MKRKTLKIIGLSLLAGVIVGMSLVARPFIDRLVESVAATDQEGTRDRAAIVFLGDAIQYFAGRESGDFFKRAVKMSHRLARPACHGSPVGRRIYFVPKGELSARSSDRVAPKIGRPGRPSCAGGSLVVASKAADQLICSCQ